MSQDTGKLYSAIYLYEELDIPQPYLKRLLTDLSKSNFIKSKQGRAGGFFFSRDINKIYLSEIIEAVEGLDSFTSCIFGNSFCSTDSICPIHEDWDKVKNDIHKILTTTSLANLQRK